MKIHPATYLGIDAIPKEWIENHELIMQLSEALYDLSYGS